MHRIAFCRKHSIKYATLWESFQTVNFFLQSLNSFVGNFVSKIIRHIMSYIFQVL